MNPNLNAPIKPVKTVFMVGVDSSADSLVAAERAFALAKGETDLVILMDVQERGTLTCTINIDSVVRPKTFKGHLERRVETGDARAVLCAQAQALGADFIVVGSRGLGALKGALLGSVSDYIVHHAPCSAIVVRS